MKGFFSPEQEGSWEHTHQEMKMETEQLQKELMSDIPEAVSFEDMVELMCADPEFIAQCEKNNAEWDEEVAAELEITLDELWDRLGIKWTPAKPPTNHPMWP